MPTSFFHTISETQEQFITRQIQRFKEHGYNPMHLWGNWYLIRNYSKKDTKFSRYILFNMKKFYEALMG